MKINVEVLSLKRADLGEGAWWDSENNLLYWVDILGKKLFIFNPLDNSTKEVKLNKEVGAVVARKNGQLILAMKGGFVLYDPITKETNTIAEVEKNLFTNRFNDGKCDPWGRFWAGTMSSKEVNGAGNLYCLELDHSVKKMIEGVTISNGIVWSNDKRSMFYIDSSTSSVVSYDYEMETGNIRNKKVIIKIDSSLGIPDGMAIDIEGMLWIALYGGGKIARYNPINGNALDLVEIPGAKLITSCSFGGDDMKDLYITTASHNLNRGELKQQPYAGSLLRARVNIAGSKLWYFKG